MLLSPSSKPDWGENLVALGDSITYGTSLDDPSQGYASLLAAELGMELTNCAVEGLQSDGLLKLLQNDRWVMASVKNADVICMSIGGNELLIPLMDVLYQRMGEVTDFGVAEVIKLMSLLGDPEVVEEIRTAAEARMLIFINTYPAVIERIYELNPDVTVVTQSVYNPYEKLMADESSPLYALRSCFDDLNDVILRTQGPIVADVGTAFLGRSGELTFSSHFDPHPNAAGHALIAELMLEKLGR